MAKKAKIEKPEISNSEKQAMAQVASILEMVENLNGSGREAAMDAITEDPLSVQVREDWHNPGEKTPVSEFEILLCTGGPACRLIGGLNEHREPDSVRVEHQDWGTFWTEHRIDQETEDKILDYCRCFYFGE